MFIPPTVEEIDRAGQSMANEGLHPVSGVVGRSGLRKFIKMCMDELDLDHSRSARELFLKSALVMGLNIGIRIGENRTTQKPQ